MFLVFMFNIAMYTFYSGFYWCVTQQVHFCWMAKPSHTSLLKGLNWGLIKVPGFLPIPSGWVAQEVAQLTEQPAAGFGASRELRFKHLQSLGKRKFGCFHLVFVSPQLLLRKSISIPIDYVVGERLQTTK